MARSRTPGRRPGAARALSDDSRAPGSAAAPSAPSLEDATRPRTWQDLRLRPLADATPARPLFAFAALPWPDPAAVVFAWGATPIDGGELVAVVLAERAGRAVMLHGPLVVAGADPMQVASQLLTAAIDHAAALGADTVFARPQGLDRVWVRFGFIPVPESALPAGLAGRPGVGLYAWRGGSALWTLRDAADPSAA